MTILERIESLEHTVRTHDVMLNLLITIGERQITMLEQHKEMLEQHKEMLERQSEMLEEIQRDSQQTQRLWVRLAERYGWLDDEVT